jgi:hypothetical protein
LTASIGVLLLVTSGYLAIDAVATWRLAEGADRLAHSDRILFDGTVAVRSLVAPARIDQVVSELGDETKPAMSARGVPGLSIPSSLLPLMRRRRAAPSPAKRARVSRSDFHMIG